MIEIIINDANLKAKSVCLIVRLDLAGDNVVYETRTVVVREILDTLLQFRRFQLAAIVFIIELEGAPQLSDFILRVFHQLTASESVDTVSKWCQHSNVKSISKMHHRLLTTTMSRL